MLSKHKAGAGSEARDLSRSERFQSVSLCWKWGRQQRRGQRGRRESVLALRWG